MKERPILFSGEMVKVILEGRKTMTRRVIKPQPSLHNGCDGQYFLWMKKYDIRTKARLMCQWCPYGLPGDRLWVRETHCIQLMPFESIDYPSGLVVYKADLPQDSSFQYEGGGSAWKPSIHMPHWASRITLEITDVRIERVQDITPAECKAEGINFPVPPPPTITEALHHLGQYNRAFENLWDSINAKRGFGWNTNPWVWVIEFKRIKTRGANDG
jgi:hypothetical protein